MADDQNIFADPEFRKLSGVDKIAVLDQLDPDFAKLPANKKPGVVFDAINGVPMAPKNKGLFYQAGQFAKTLGGDIVGAATGLARAAVPEIDVMQGRPTVGQEVVGAQKKQFEKAGEEFKQGRYSEAAGHGLAGVLPLVGPLAAQTGEEIGEGEYGRAAAHGLELSLPYTARPIVRGATAAARGGQAVAGGAARVADLPVIRNVPFVRDVRGMLRDIAGRNPGMSPAELAQGLYKEVNGRAPRTAGEKIEAVRMYREAVKPAPKPKPAKPPAPPKGPEPFKPSAATARQMKFGGPTEQEFTTPKGIAPKRVFGKPARELPESYTPGATEPPAPPKPPEPFKTSATTARKMKFGGRTEPEFRAGAGRGGVRRGINRAMMPEKEVAEGAEEAAAEEPARPEPPRPQSPTGKSATFGRERFQVVAAAAKDQAILPALDELNLSPEEIENPNVLSDQDIDKIIDKVNDDRATFNKTAKEKGLNKLSIFKHPNPGMESYRTYQELRTSWARAKRIRDALKSKRPGSVQ